MAEQVYDANVDTITGDKLFIFIDGQPIAFGTSCGLDISADSIDTANKMSGSWKTSLVGQLGYTLSSDSLMSKKDGHMSFKTLKEAMATKQPVEFVMGTPSADFSVGEEWYKGKAYITALNLKADNNAVCTSTVTLTGSGALEDGSTPAPAPAQG